MLASLGHQPVIVHEIVPAGYIYQLRHRQVVKQTIARKKAWCLASFVTGGHSRASMMISPPNQ
jgi:hypothetical protein